MLSSSTAAPVHLDRNQLLDWYRRNRARSQRLFDLLADDETYYSQPISLRHPIVFYEGHLAAFSFNTLVKQALGRPNIDADLETLFARGIDPSEQAAAAGDPARNRALWPTRTSVQQFARDADRLVLDAIANADLDRPGHPLLDRAEAVFTILEHEAMHQETLLYMWHRLPFERKRRPADYAPRVPGAVPAREWIGIPAGRATIGVERSHVPFGWDNEFPAMTAHVPAFAIERHNVTNQAFLEFVDAGGYRNESLWSAGDSAWLRAGRIEHPLFWERENDAWYWRGMFDRVALPLAWPVYATHAEASAYARWKGTRLPSEAEYQRAAYGAPDGNERRHPWGDAPPDPAHGVFDFSSWDPEPAGSHQAGCSAWGVHDLMGNGWEWTSTAFAPFAGFQAMASYPQYSADFFDGQHYVVKGASPATARELLRPTFRNWFRTRYPYVYASFRCVRGSA